VYEDSLIFYDTGDFVDDYAVDSRLRNDRGFFFEVTVTSNGRLLELRLIPTEIAEFAVHRAFPSVARWCRDTMRVRSSRFETQFERDGETLVVRVDAH
jgi:poly-gamma-glutamate synthesis protein (capsule biosynthesis protein)